MDADGSCCSTLALKALVLKTKRISITIAVSIFKGASIT